MYGHMWGLGALQFSQLGSARLAVRKRLWDVYVRDESISFPRALLPAAPRFMTGTWFFSAGARGLTHDLCAYKAHPLPTELGVSTFAQNQASHGAC